MFNYNIKLKERVFLDYVVLSSQSHLKLLLPSASWRVQYDIVASSSTGSINPLTYMYMHVHAQAIHPISLNKCRP